MKATRNAATTIGRILFRNEPATPNAIVSTAIAAITRPKRVAPAQDRSRDAVMAAAPPSPAARGAKTASAMIVSTTVTNTQPRSWCTRERRVSSARRSASASRSGSDRIGCERPSCSATAVGAMSAIETSPRIRVESEVRMPW